MRFKSLIIILLAITVCLSNIEAQASDRLQSLIDAANESIRNNQLDRAKQQLKQAIHIKFNAAEPHYLQGKIAEQSGNLRKAAREYKSAINFDAKHLLAAISWGRVANKLNDFDAVAAYKHAIDIDPDNPLWKLKLSQFYMSQKSVNIRMRAQRQLKNILALKPNHRQALQLLVELERDLGMLARAKQYQHRLDQLTPYSSAATEPAPSHQTGSSNRANVRIHARPRNRVRSAPAIHYVADVSATSAVSHQKTPKKRSSSGLSHQDMALLDLQDDRTNKQNEQRALEQELGAAEDKASIIEAEISIKEGTVHRLKKDVSDRLKRLERAEAFSRDDPDFDIGKYKQRWRDTKQQYDRAKQDLDASNQELKQISVVIQAKKKRLTRSKQQLIAFDQEIALARFAKIKRNIEQEHVVNAHGEAACENMTLKACKQSALLNAEHNAVEQGSAVMIESLTEIKDFAVSRNEIRSRMRAIIIGKEIVKKGWIGESAYFYDITATVRGQVPPELNPSQHSGAMPRRHLDSSRFRLIIQTTPRYADIVIEGLGRQYTPGIHLEPGRYSIIISAEGYQTVRQQIEMIDSDMTLPIDMRRIANNDRRASSESIACKKASAMMDEARMIYSPMKKERLMHTATTICPQNAGFLYELGTMYAKRKQTGDWRKAKRAFEGVLRLDPSYPNAREKLNAINQQQRNGANGAGAAQVLMGIGSLLLQ